MNDVFSWPVGCANHCETLDRSEKAPLLPVLAYMTGCAIAGASTGFLLALLGAVVRDASPLADLLTTAAAVTLVLAAVLLELKGRVAPLPQLKAQVPRRWLAWRRRAWTAGAFGLVIGSGVLTHLQHAVAYALAALILLAPSPLVGLGIGSAYGATRGLALLATWLGDRYLGSRFAWDQLARRRAMSHELAAAAAICCSLAVVTTI